MVVDFVGTAPDGTPLADFRSSINMQTGELVVGGQSKGHLPESPADTIISVIDKGGRGSISLPELVERSVGVCDE
jgi:hypothetical protein